MTETFLNIGCGPVLLPYHVNIDMRPWPELVEWAGGELELPEGAYYLQHNCIADMPFDDATVAGINADNVLEHLSVCYDELQAFLASAWRVLRPGGYLQGEVPDFRKVIDYYLQDAQWEWDEGATSGAYARPAENALANFAHGWEHKAIFSGPMLAHLLQTCGFANVTITPEARVQMRFYCEKPGSEA